MMDQNVFYGFLGEGRQVKLDAGDVLFFSREPVSRLYLVRAGRVKLVRHTSEGKALVFQLATAGDTLAEASLFSDAYHCTAIADDPAVVLAYDKADVLAALAADADFSSRVMADLAGKIIDLRGRLELRNVRSARERILQYLELLSADDGVVHFHQPLKTVAAEIGLSHEALYRAMSVLERDAVIERRDRMIRIIR